MDNKEPKTRMEKKGDKQKRKKELFGKYNTKHTRPTIKPTVKPHTTR